MAAGLQEAEKESKTNMEINSKTQEKEGNIFDAPECPVDKVVVYQDRAEVCRVIETNLKKGENEVFVKNFSQWVDSDSLRVEGKGPATILEVSYQNKYANPTHEETEERKSHSEELRKQLVTLEYKLSELQAAKARVQKQWKVLEQFSESVTKMGASIHSDENSRTTVTKLDKNQLDGINNFFDLYDSQSQRLDTNLLDLDRQIKKVEEEKTALKNNMRELGIYKNIDVSRQCSILLECNEDDAQVTLLVSYVVSNASWSPKYDIRVFPEEKMLKVMYYGIIQQSTEEDWEDAKLFLSTAMPSIGGTMPTLGRTTIQIKRPMPVPRLMKAGLSRKSLSFRKKKTRSFQLDSDEDQVLGMALCDMPVGLTIEEKSAPIEEIQAEAKEGLTSTTFEITRSASIPSDNVGHKVAVGIIDLNPEFEYETVPILSPQAFLKARVTNKSQYAFLPGPTNIFLDNNFVAKSELSAVSPAEEFLVSLGVDPAVRITYKPLSKFQEKSGLLTKVKTITHKQDIEVKNTHKDPVNIKVIDSVPISTEDKIKVNILEPTVSVRHPEKVEGHEIARLTKDNNHVEWQFAVKGSDKREITLKYTIEYPAGDEVDITTS